MTWSPAISLKVAQTIFHQHEIQAHEVDGKVAYYSGAVKGDRVEDTGLTRLCTRIVEALHN